METLWIEIEGKDAADFLQRQMTADVKTLRNPGQGAFTLWLTPTGRIEVAGALWRRENGFVLQCPLVDHLPSQEEVLAFLDKWHFGEDMSWVSSIRRFKPIELEPVEGLPSLTVDGFSWPSGQGFGATAFKEGSGQELQGDAFLGIRHFGREIQSGRNPLDIGLDAFLPQQKGCYPGQEVIERIRSKGQPASRCVLVHGLKQGAAKEGDALDQDKGVVTSVYLEHMVIWVRRLAVVEDLSFQGEALSVAKDPW